MAAASPTLEQALVGFVRSQTLTANQYLNNKLRSAINNFQSIDAWVLERGMTKYHKRLFMEFGWQRCR